MKRIKQEQKKLQDLNQHLEDEVNTNNISVSLCSSFSVDLFLDLIPIVTQMLLVFNILLWGILFLGVLLNQTFFVITVVIFCDCVTLKTPHPEGGWHQQEHVARRFPRLTSKVTWPEGTLITAPIIPWIEDGCLLVTIEISRKRPVFVGVTDLKQ